LGPVELIFRMRDRSTDQVRGRYDRFGISPFRAIAAAAHRRGGLESVVNLTVAVTADHGSDVELRSLLEWLAPEDELRGRLTLTTTAPDPERLGTATEVLAAVLGPGGAGVLAGSLVAWIRHRTSDVSFRVNKPDGTAMEVSGRRVQRVDAVAIRALADSLTQWIEKEQDGPGAGTSDLDIER
jgi:hypothetical protein